MKKYLFGAAAGVIAATCAQGASAQSEPPARSGQSTSLEEVVVTAQRREQRAQDVGIAISVLSGDSLAQQGVVNVNQLQNNTPNLEVEPAFGGGQPQFRIRGVGFQDYAANNSPTVGVYVDEVAFPVPVMTQGLLFDIDRVEVLRGPQGTLYGRNTTGGAINFLTRNPTTDFHAGGSLEAGSYGHVVTEGYASGPLSDTVSARFSIGMEHGGGFQHNRVTGQGLGDADKVAARAKFDWKASENLDMRLTLHAAYDHSEAQGDYLFSDFHTAFGFGPTIPADTDRFATGWGFRPAFAAENGFSPTRKPGKHNNMAGADGYIDYDFGNVRLSSITSYEQMHRNEVGDWDTTQFAESDVFWGGDEKVFSQELRFASTGEGRLHWVAGAYYSHQTQNEIYASDFTNVFGLSAHITYDQKVESISGFGQAEYVFTDRLKLIGGLRYEHETRDLNNFTSAFGGGTALPPTDATTDMSPVTGKAELDFKPVDRVLLYASASKGVKSGGFTTYNTASAAGISPFLPEKLYAYEAGFKTNLTPEFQLNGAAYYYDYRDQQVLSIVCTANGAVGRFANAPKSQIHGFELEGVWQPVGGLRISQSASYKKGEFKEFQDEDVAACQADFGHSHPINRAGDPIKFPKWSYGGDISYDWLMGGMRVTAQTDYSWHDRYPSWLGATYDVSSYWLVNASLSLAPAQASWGVTLFARNLFNENYDLTRNFFVNANIAQPGAPRTYGLRLNYDF
jgi:outer membrane receptor protein involved in Fe transport